jgi:F-type H+-transporting ATPase subunit gamma
VVIASRRGLCGSYNNAVVDRAAERVRELRKAGRAILVGSSGKRGQLILEALGCGADRVFPQFDRTPEQAAVRTMADGLMREFLGGEIAGVEIAYTRFISTGQQKPAIATLLPLAVGPSAPGASDRAARGPGAGDELASRPLGEPVPPTYLPGRADVLGSLIP